MLNTLNVICFNYLIALTLNTDGELGISVAYFPQVLKKSIGTYRVKERLKSLVTSPTQ